MTDLRFSTIPGLLSSVKGSHANPSALNIRFGKSWEQVSTATMVESVERLAAGLRTLGVESGDAVGILAPSGASWLMMDMAIMLAGAVTVPMFSDLSAENLAFEIRNSGMRVVFVEDSDHYEALSGVEVAFERIITLGLSQDEPSMIAWDDVLEAGRVALAADPDCLPEVLPDDLASIVYTSGSTGVPKGVEISHRGLTHQVHACRRCFSFSEGEPVVSCLPLAHIYERVVMYSHIASGVSVYFADEIKKVAEVMRDVKPTTITVVPRILEKVHARLIAGANGGSWSKRALGRLAVHQAEVDVPGDEHYDVAHWLSDKLVYTKFRAALGGNLKQVIVGGSAMDKEVLRFLSNVGIPIYEGYGMTETTAVATVNTPNRGRLGSVGRPFPGSKIQISADGEVLVKGVGVTSGYHKDPEATARLIDAEGWLHTGDLGELDADGYLTITGRKKDLFKTSQGKYVSPVAIEQRLCRNALIDMAMIVGENRKFVSCLLFPDRDNLHKLKRTYGLAGLSDEDCLAHPALVSRMDQLVSAVNGTLNSWEQVRKYALILTPLDAEGGSLTPTMKIRRHVVRDQFSDQIERMYESIAGDGLGLKALCDETEE